MPYFLIKLLVLVGFIVELINPDVPFVRAAPYQSIRSRTVFHKTAQQKWVKQKKIPAEKCAPLSQTNDDDDHDDDNIIHVHVSTVESPLALHPTPTFLCVIDFPEPTVCADGIRRQTLQPPIA